jgi:DNA polymerase III alpha subunit (gram-positive type)
MDPQERLLRAESRQILLKPRGAEPTRFDGPLTYGEAAELNTPLEAAQYVALDIETTGNRPFLILEIGAERFALSGPLAFFDTLVDCRAPINPYARRRHQIDRSMLVGAPGFGDARSAFLRFARGAVLVEHSHDAFDTYLLGRGLRSPLEHLIIDTSALARLVLDLPTGQTPGLVRVVEELELDTVPEHAALGDARATAMVFRELIQRGRERWGWTTVGEIVALLPRPAIDRSRIETGRSAAVSRTGSSAGRAEDAPARTGQPRSGAPAATPGATSPAPRGRRGRSSRGRRSGSSG